MRRGILAALAAALGCLVLGVGSASAATTVGQLFGTSETCNGGASTWLQTGVASGNSYTVPAAGVISSWQFGTGGTTSGVKLKVGRTSDGGSTWVVIGESVAGTPGSSPSPADIPVKPGDVIGISVPSGTGCALATPNDSDKYMFGDGDVAVGSSVSQHGDDEKFPVSATITGPPTSSASVPACPDGGPVTGTVTADTGGTAKRFHYKVDGGPEQTIDTSGDPGTASVTLPAGHHSLEYWGEDSFGQQEASHHTVGAGCPPPGVAPPTSSASVPSCPKGGPVTGTVTAAAGATAKRLHYKVDGGPEQTVETTGNPGTASITLPAGVHSLEYWGEDGFGQQEATHHTVSAGCPPPTPGAPTTTPSTPTATPGGATATAPQILPLSHVFSLGASATTFRVSGTPQAVTLAGRRAPVGTTFTFGLDHAAAIRLDFLQNLSGRRANRHCVAPTSHNKRKPRCSRNVSRGTLTVAGQAGANTIKFYGWVTPTKKLRPGRYVLVITATTPGRGSTSQKLAFNIVH